FTSAGYGSRQFVSVRSQTGSFASVDTGGAAKTRVVGRDAIATVNGAVAIGDGLNLKVNTSELDIDFALDSTFGQHATSFVVTGGGALFQLGPQVNSSQQVS